MTTCCTCRKNSAQPFVSGRQRPLYIARPQVASRSGEVLQPRRGPSDLVLAPGDTGRARALMGAIREDSASGGA